MALNEPPEGLGPQGMTLWQEIGEVFELRVDELRILGDACREVDLIERMHVALLDAPLLVKGSMGQEVANPLVQELRQHRALVARLLSALKLPDDEEQEDTDGRARSSQARKAALARWGRTG
ncbi:hypothetical protein [Streptomyces sp. NPDC048462]|uniref:hypothetical protein n=1 Tax=Streptomyces sp. NPDC048462 TaxID=3365555 RepID=UPI00371D9165